MKGLSQVLKLRLLSQLNFVLKSYSQKVDLAETFVLDLSLGLSLNFHITTVVFDGHVTLFVHIKDVLSNMLLLE